MAAGCWDMAVVGKMNEWCHHLTIMVAPLATQVDGQDLSPNSREENIPVVHEYSRQ